MSAAPVIRASPTTRLGDLAQDSIAPSVFAIVDRGVLLRPDVAAELSGSVRLSFAEGHPSVRIDLGGPEVLVADDRGERAADVEIRGALPDVIALLAAPLAGGVPKPTSRRGRAALARLADGRVEVEGPLRLARGVLRLLIIDAD